MPNQSTQIFEEDNASKAVMGAVMGGRNFMDNPFAELSIIEAVEKVREFLIRNDIDLEELQVRRTQLQIVNPQAYARAEREGLIKIWLKLELHLGSS